MKERERRETVTYRVVWKDHPRYTASWLLYDEKGRKNGNNDICR